MTNYYLVTGVLGHIVLCVSEGTFKEHFIIDGRWCTHEWYECLIKNFWDEQLQEAWDLFIESHRIDGKESVVTFGELAEDAKIVGIYEWSY